MRCQAGSQTRGSNCGTLRRATDGQDTWAQDSWRIICRADGPPQQQRSSILTLKGSAEGTAMAGRRTHWSLYRVGSRGVACRTKFSNVRFRAGQFYERMTAVGRTLSINLQFKYRPKAVLRFSRKRRFNVKMTGPPTLAAEPPPAVVGPCRLTC
jgi:hypothetical protein